MRTLIITWIVLLAMQVWSQDTITLEMCYREVTENAPRFRDREVIQSTGELKKANTGSKWLPELNLNGRASYQSDVVTIALSNPVIPVEFPGVPHDQYSLNLDLSQVIYDGGMTRRQKEYETVSTALELKQMEVDLHKLKEQVNSIYFSILILQQNRQNILVTMKNLSERERQVQSGIENGVILESELKVLRVESLKLEQALLEIDASRESAVEILGIYMGRELDPSTVLLEADLDNIIENDLKRPEYALFHLQEASLEAGRELTRIKRMPVLYAFGQAGYGKPGYNMLNGEWDIYYMVGAGLKWNIWDWNRNRREREILEQKQLMVDHTRKSFELNISARLAGEKAKIEQYRQSLELDERMLKLQEEITAEAASKLENGVITASDFITELNRENLARIRKETHRIMMNQAAARYLTIQGKL